MTSAVLGGELPKVKIDNPPPPEPGATRRNLHWEKTIPDLYDSLQLTPACTLVPLPIKKGSLTECGEMGTVKKYQTCPIEIEDQKLAEVFPAGSKLQAVWLGGADIRHDETVEFFPQELVIRSTAEGGIDIGDWQQPISELRVLYSTETVDGQPRQVIQAMLVKNSEEKAPGIIDHQWAMIFRCEPDNKGVVKYSGLQGYWNCVNRIGGTVVSYVTYGEFDTVVRAGDELPLTQAKPDQADMYWLWPLVVDGLTLEDVIEATKYYRASVSGYESIPKKDGLTELEQHEQEAVEPLKLHDLKKTFPVNEDFIKTIRSLDYSK